MPLDNTGKCLPQVREIIGEEYADIIDKLERNNSGSFQNKTIVASNLLAAAMQTRTQEKLDEANKTNTRWIIILTVVLAIAAIAQIVTDIVLWNLSKSM